jgi:tripartite-type tricarboxylate transporter receptor subunit TctC
LRKREIQVSGKTSFLRAEAAHALAGGLMLAAGAGALAQAYPAKAVRVVVPYAPGGGSDVISRILAQRMSESLGRQFVIDNRAGANGIIGTEMVVQAPADGYTLLYVSSPHAVNPSMYRKLPYDTVKDLTPISEVAIASLVLVVHPSLPVRSVAELVALAKARPGQIDYASGGSGGSPHLATELFKKVAGINLNHVPYRGAGPALTDVLAGQVQVMFSSSAAALPHVRAGRLRALGISSTKRSAVAPEIPTVAESGVPGFEAVTIFGLVAPANTPRPVVELLNAAVHKAMGAAGVGDSLKALGADVAVSTPEAFGGIIESEIKRWGELVRALKLQVE